jgi:hypothetical protein
MLRKNINAHERIGADRTEGFSGMITRRGCPRSFLIVRRVDHVHRRGLKIAEGCFCLNRHTVPTVGAHHAVQNRDENVQD